MSFANIRPKRTDISGNQPDPSILLDGEIFINRADKTLGFKDADGSVQYIVNVAGAGDNIVHKSGAETITGQKTFTSVIEGTAQRALWADLAENYESDRAYTAGTLIQFGGTKEITQARTHVNGVISDKPAYLMNNQPSSKKIWLPVVLVGRVKIKVVGRVEKFDKLVLSTEPGCAVVDNSAFDSEIIGIALKSKHTSGIGNVLCFSRILV